MAISIKPKSKIKLIGLIVLILAVTACLAFAVFRFFCVQTYDVSLKTGEVYEITDKSELDTTMTTTFKSTDKEIATLSGGKYIYARSVGNAKISVFDGEKRSKYNVTVSKDDSKGSVYSDESRSFASDFSEKYIFDDEDICRVFSIGHGYNALKNFECNEETIGENSILDVEKILNSDDLYVNDDPATQTDSYSGADFNSFMKSYSKKTSVSVSVKFLGFTAYKKSKNFSVLNLDSNKSIKGISQINVKKRLVSIFLNIDSDECYDFLLPEAKNALLGEDGTSVKDFIEEYGTHVLLGGNYGTSISYTYSLAYSDGITNYDGIKKNMEKVNRAIANIYSQGYANENINDVKICNSSLVILKNSKGLFSIEGAVGRTNDANIDQIIRLIEFLRYNEVDAEELGAYGAIKALISPCNSQSLLPVWEMIPTDTPEHKQRKQDFINYVKQQTRQ